jgi:MFS family permease
MRREVLRPEITVEPVTLIHIVRIGAALSQTIAGSIVHHVGFRAGFLFLAGVALAAFAILFTMPLLRHIRLSSPRSGDVNTFAKL